MRPSAIGWTDYSGGPLNFVTGCTPVSAGCAHCYARAIYDRFGLDWTPTFHQDKLDALITQRFPVYSPKRGMPHKPMAFVCDIGDLFHESIRAEDILCAFDAMAYRKDVIWQVLTKRPQRMADVLFGEAGDHYLGGGDYWPNIWLGVSVEDQATADERIPVLLDAYTGTTFVSVEPMLGPVDLRPYLRPAEGKKRLDWVICGGESGARARGMEPAWAYDLWHQCQWADVPFFGKQRSGPRPGLPLELGGQVRQAWPEEG